MAVRDEGRLVGDRSRRHLELHAPVGPSLADVRRELRDTPQERERVRAQSSQRPHDPFHDASTTNTPSSIVQDEMVHGNRAHRMPLGDAASRCASGSSVTQPDPGSASASSSTFGENASPGPTPWPRSSMSQRRPSIADPRRQAGSVSNGRTCAITIVTFSLPTTSSEWGWRAPEPDHVVRFQLDAIDEPIPEPERHPPSRDPRDEVRGMQSAET